MIPSEGGTNDQGELTLLMLSTLQPWALALGEVQTAPSEFVLC